MATEPNRSSASSTEEVEFTYDWYETCLQELRDHGYTCKGFDDDLGEGDLLLRHDIDLSPRKALRMARIEADLGMTATYFVLLTSPLYNVFHDTHREVLAELRRLGHEVGLHFSTHQYWSSEPPSRELVRRIRREHEALRACVDAPSEAVTFHCPPDWILRRDFDEFDSGYAERFFTDVAYRGDSQQRWRAEHPFADGYPETIQVLVHPGLWGERDRDYRSRITDAIAHHTERTARVIVAQLIEERFDPAHHRYRVESRSQ